MAHPNPPRRKRQQNSPERSLIRRILDDRQKTIVHIPNVNARVSTKDEIKEAEHIVDALGAWRGVDPETGFHLVETADGRTLKIADLVDDDPAKRGKVIAALRRWTNPREPPRRMG